jgi:tryptophanase
MFGRHEEAGGFVPARLELVRLALPRRVYTQSHVDRILEICGDVAARAHLLGGYEMTYCPPYLRHFTAAFRPLPRVAPTFEIPHPDPYETELLIVR